MTEAVETLLCDIIERLDQIIERLDRADAEPPDQRRPKLPDLGGTPYVPSPIPFPYNDQDETCPRCGLRLTGVMSYACARVDCPTGLGPTSM